MDATTKELVEEKSFAYSGLLGVILLCQNCIVWLLIYKYFLTLSERERGSEWTMAITVTIEQSDFSFFC